MKTKCKYCCEICGEEYEKEEDALFCESLPTLMPAEKIGTIVRLKNTGDKGAIVGFKYYRSVTQNAHIPEYNILLENRASTWRTLVQIDILQPA